MINQTKQVTWLEQVVMEHAEAIMLLLSKRGYELEAVNGLQSIDIHIHKNKEGDTIKISNILTGLDIRKEYKHKVDWKEKIQAEELLI